MPTVWIPSLLQALTSGQEQVEVPGETLRQVIAALDERYPGLKDRLCDGDRLRPSMVAVVNGEVSQKGLRHRLDASSEVHFLPAMSGGRGISLIIER
jgi:molybdopterin synthase sulfur carrier subunit